MDAAGQVRSATLITNAPTLWAGKLTRIGPSDYWALGDSNLFRLKIPEPSSELSPPAEQVKTVNAGDSITLSAAPDPVGAAAYRWFRNGREIVGARDHDLRLQNFSFADSGQYSVKIRTAFGAVTNRIATLNYSGPTVIAAENTGVDILIYWPAAAGNFKLQEASSVKGLYANVAGASVTNTSLQRIEMRVSGTKSERYYRLAKP